MRKKVTAAFLFVSLFITTMVPAGTAGSSSEHQKTFLSYNELRDFIAARLEIADFDSSFFPAPTRWRYHGGYYAVDDSIRVWPSLPEPAMADLAGSIPVGGLASATIERIEFSMGSDEETNTLQDYSRTNIQVDGVDEADIVKNEGEFIYLVSRTKLLIIRAHPAQSAKVLSKIELGGPPYEMLKNGDRLVVFGTISQTNQTFVKIYDVYDKENPVELKEIKIDGGYYDSRMVGNQIYLIVNSPLKYLNGEIELPTITNDNEVRKINASEIQYFDTFETSYWFTIILSLDLSDKNMEYSSKVLLMGSTQNMFVSSNNIYITYSKGSDAPSYWDGLIRRMSGNLPTNVRNEIEQSKTEDLSFLQRVRRIKNITFVYYENIENDAKWDFKRKIDRDVWATRSEVSQEATVVHRISIAGGKIKHKASGEVPGHVLNQFSMDEFNGYFRITTTTEWGNRARNHVYVLDEELYVVGKLENLAPTERIYSARFMGNRLYLVTFRIKDPLFVIDLKNVNTPTVLGELVIPGYSDYLHPYDENHIIGVGRNSGVKMALFDVSDPKKSK